MPQDDVGGYGARTAPSVYLAVGRAFLESWSVPPQRLSGVAFAAAYHPLLEGHPAAVIADEALKRPLQRSQRPRVVEHDTPRTIFLSEGLVREASGVSLGNRPRDVLDYFSHELVHLLDPALPEPDVHHRSDELSASMRRDCPHLDPGRRLTTRSDEHVLACWAATNGVRLSPLKRQPGLVRLLVGWWEAVRVWVR